MFLPGVAEKEEAKERAKKLKGLYSWLWPQALFGYGNSGQGQSSPAPQSVGKSSGDQSAQAQKDRVCKTKAA
jgi:hypothetical protein